MSTANGVIGPSAGRAVQSSAPMRAVRMFSVELHAHDVGGVAAFYRDVLGIPLEPGDDDRTHFETYWGEWGSESTAPFFFFAVQPLADGRTQTSGVEIGFEVSDLDAVHRRVVDAGATVVESPSDRPWGRSASYSDPLGNTVELTEG